MTAIYEIVPAGRAIDDPAVDPLRYQKSEPTTTSRGSGEWMHVKVRYKLPEARTSKKVERSVLEASTSLAATSDDFRFATAVAAFGMRLRDSPHLAAFDDASIVALAESGLGADPHGLPS